MEEKTVQPSSAANIIYLGKKTKRKLVEKDITMQYLASY